MLSTVQRPFILLILQCALRLILASIIPSSATSAAAFSHDNASQYPGISHLPTAATTPSLLSPLLMLPTPPPAEQQVSDSQHARPPPPSAAPRIGAPRQAITLAAFLLLSAFICGLAVGLAKCARSYWRTPRNTGVVRWWEQPDAQWRDNVLEGEGLFSPPPPPYFPRPPSYVDDCGANLMAQDDLAVGSRFDSGGRRYSV
ncbi:hypothetical protein B0H14DRAFT_2785885 [Mycena olivaceomarginata]|nr:hypothetical protein B0H14DRAFT_2785885 [Mycena olivaceomarginata]